MITHLEDKDANLGIYELQTQDEYNDESQRMENTLAFWWRNEPVDSIIYSVRALDSGNSVMNVEVRPSIQEVLWCHGPWRRIPSEFDRAFFNAWAEGQGIKGLTHPEVKGPQVGAGSTPIPARLLEKWRAQNQTEEDGFITFIRGTRSDSAENC